MTKRINSATCPRSSPKGNALYPLAILLLLILSGILSPAGAGQGPDYSVIDSFLLRNLRQMDASDDIEILVQFRDGVEEDRLYTP